MFDPSKLDLELNKNNSWENNPEPIKQAKKVEADTLKDNSDKESNVNTDILENISIGEEINEATEELINQEITTEVVEEEKIIKKELDEKNLWRTEYEKSIKKEIIQESNNEEEETTIEEKNKIIFDINLRSIDILLKLLVDNEYDFAIFEPSEDSVKVTFTKEKTIVDTKYIKYPTYSNILVKAKALTKLTIEETENEQEWNWEATISNKAFKILTKVVPTELWSKLFIKTKQIEKKVAKKQTNTTSTNQIFWFLWALAFIALIVWWGFIWFIVVNAKTVEDVKFFQSLWISLNDINNFISQAISIIFSILVFIETIFLITFLFKFSLTKKEFKQKKIRYWIISTIIFIVTFATASTWMIIDQKVKNLPDWYSESKWEIQLYDNSKLLSDDFNENWSIINDTSNLIWPVSIKFDLDIYKKHQERKGLTVKKYIWNFWNEKEIIETPNDFTIHTFKEKWIYEISLTTVKVDPSWEITEELVTWIPNINISYVIDIDEQNLNSWWKLVSFDASNISELGKIEWYFMDNLSKPVWKWEKFKVWKPIFEETLIWMYIRSDDKKSETIDKIFVITAEEENNLDWKISYERWLIKDLEFELWVDDLNNDFWNWFIEEFKWIIWTKEITKTWDINNSSDSSKIKHTFKTYWKYNVTVILKNSSWNTKEIKTEIDIPKVLKLLKPLRVFNNSELIENINYDKNVSEYYINEVWIPTSLKFDARFVKSNNLLYNLKSVSWDVNSDWDIDDTWKTFNYNINKEGNHNLTVNYEFVHRKIPDDTIKISEQIFIEWVKKEAIIDFKINKDSNYVPVVVGFDASKSQVKDENIEKFIWDYWDGQNEERDAVVRGHRYTTPWNYDIVLKVVTDTWKSFTTTKKLILKPKPQAAKITASMKKAPIWQAIDFSSDKSEWQIIWYFWEFGNWKTSTDPNPTNLYKKAWTYTIKLTLDFANKSIEVDTMEIVIE